MKLRNLYLINAAVSLIFAVALLLMSPVMLRLFSMDNTKDAVTLGQLLAVELTANGLVTLLLRDTADSKTRSAVNYANIFAGALGFVVALNATLTGVFGWFGWVIAGIYGVLTLAFAYFQFFGSPEHS